MNIVQEKNKFYDLKNYQGKKLPMISDTMFHCMFNNSKRKKYAAYLISLVLNLPFKEVNDSLIYINNKVDLESVKDPKKCVDFLCKINDNYIGIEMNNNPNMVSLERNISYAAETYKRETAPEKDRYNFKKVIQININNFSFDITKKVIESYQLRNEEGEELTDKIKIICISLSLIKEKLYNKEKLTELERFLLVANEEDEGLVNKLSEGCGIMKEYDKEAKKVSSDEEVLDLYSYERKILAEKAEAVYQVREEAREESLFEVAKRMIKENLDILTISKCTGLSKSEIEKLK